MNIVELVTSQLNRDVVGNIRSLIGENPERTKTALGAAVPAPLAGITQLASKPEGARQLERRTERPELEARFYFAPSLI
jgi:hypothetical protein